MWKTRPGKLGLTFLAFVMLMFLMLGIAAWNIYAAWVFLLVAQNASFTWVSRARNSGDDYYHASAAVFSNGVWLFQNVFIVGFLAAIVFGKPLQIVSLDTFTGRWGDLLLVAAVYVTLTVTGSVSSGWFLRKYVEKGKRQVGHYDDKEARIKKLEERLDLLTMGRKRAYEMPLREAIARQIAADA